MHPITIRHIRKQFFDGTHRARSPEETYATIKPLMDEIGVTDVIDITPLDRLGIPVYNALRPRAARGSLPVHAGKGKEPLHSEISAMMEAIERFSGEYRGDPMEYTSHEELGLLRSLDPRELFLPRPLEMGEKLHWTPSWDLLNHEEIFVPSNAVYHPYVTLGMTDRLFRSDTNGLAGGNEIEEAILHAVFEVVERDALSMAERIRSMGQRLALGDDGPARTLLDTFEKNGIAIHLWLLNGKTDLPTVAAAAEDTVTEDPSLLVMGSGTHTDPEIAAVRALTEVAQSRASYLQGDRTDPVRDLVIRRAGYERMRRINRIWFDDAEEIDIGDVSNLSTPTIDGDLKIALREIEEHADRVLVSDLSRTKVPVVKVIIPGFEVSYMDRTRRKPRKEGLI
jgi:ribosomal protein S12 methylthiotransferase accessory factor